MATVAVPEYLSKLGPNFYQSAPPGHRFSLYLRVWGENLETRATDWRTKDRLPRLDKKTGQQKIEKGKPVWDDVPNDLYAAQIAACGLPSDTEAARENPPKTELGIAPWTPMLDALTERQSAFVNADTLTLPAISTAPFATGLGIEHPLENGFAFLNPYGLPYLPGSSVKGVLRKAAQELEQELFGGTQGWTAEIITALFGLESEDRDRQHQRGTLTFWDVIPQIKNNRLAVEIMTPHQSHYLQGTASPHDSGSLNPISFLAVPAGSEFRFHVDCDRRRLKLLAPDLLADKPQDDPWRVLIGAAFDHAYEWLGFGAKTAVGYGAMTRDRQKEEAAARRAQAERQRQRDADEAKAREAAEQARRESEAAERARQQAEFDALSETQKALVTARQAIQVFQAAPETLPQVQRDTLKQRVLSTIKPLREQAQTWPDAAEREDAATILESAFEQIGWYEPGIDKKKRDKQTQKKRDLIAMIRAAKS